MATPTPPQASKRVVGAAASPSHLNPASPTATRHAAGKTPVNHPTSGSSGSKTLVSTPMVQNLSQTGMNSSPSTNMLSFNTPGAAAIDGTTPAILNMSTPALGGTQMIPTMSDLGLTTSSSKRNEEEERRAKMRKVLKTIGRPKGRVSEEGIARIGRRVGFQNDIDVEKLTAEEMERKAGNRQIITAGNIIVVEFDLRDHVPQRVNVVLPQTLKAQEEAIASVLFDDLGGSDRASLEAKLDRFSLDLERLARIDRLSSKGTNCFEALAGVYTSLRRLYNQELLIAKSLMKDTRTNIESTVDTEVMCKKSGKPLLHARGRIGLEIQYWAQNRHATDSSNADPLDTFVLHIGIESSSAALYPSLRNSDAWLPDPLDLADPDSGEGIPWQDPPPTLLPSGTDPTSMVIDGEQKLPDLRFVATFDPPLVMPYQTAMNILSAVGAAVPQMLAMPLQYAALLLDEPAATHTQPSTLPFTKSAEQNVLSQMDGEETIVAHRYTLASAKPDYGFRLEELPFSHPRQLLELLPTLRQWAAMGSLLKGLFRQGDTITTSHKTVNGKSQFDAQNPRPMTLDDILTLEDETLSQTATPINIALVTLPAPTLSLTFPELGDMRSGSINLQVLPNAEILVTQHEGLYSNGIDVNATAQKLAKALDACGDLGVWIEWIRTRLHGMS